MPLDSQLFADVKSSLAFNMTATHELDDKDPKKFVFNSFDRAAHAMRRAVHLVPRARIEQDCSRWTRVIEDIIKYEGAKLPGNDATGKRFYQYNVKERTERRIEQLHADAKPSFENMIKSGDNCFDILIEQVDEDFDMSVDTADDLAGEALVDDEGAVNENIYNAMVGAEGEGLLVEEEEEDDGMGGEEGQGMEGTDFGEN
jgi:hypothetical protein